MKLLSAFTFVLCCAAGLWAAVAAEQESLPTFRTRAAGVQIDVLVTDEERPVTGLTAKDFELTDSGVAQDIQVTTLRDLPVDVIIVLDVSTSLREQGLKHLVRATDTLLGSLQPRDRAGLVTFSQVVVIRAPSATSVSRRA
jgi:von Willebrand factor type A domain